MNNTIVTRPNGDFEVLTDAIEVDDEPEERLFDDDEPEELIVRGGCEACDGDLNMIGHLGKKPYFRCQTCKRIF